MPPHPELRRRLRARRALGFFFRVGLSISVIGLLGAGAVAYIAYRDLIHDLPSVERITSYQPAIASQVYAGGGKLIGELYLEKRYFVPIAAIPELVREAFLAAEDAGFYRHSGTDFQGILRAAWSNFVAGEVTQGASTITQQVVKLLLLTPERSYSRKAKEIILSRRLEQALSKDQILEIYLNQIYLGSGAYGVEAAAQEYFGKPIHEIDLAEASLLAGLPQAPSRYSPIRYPERARNRRRYVLERMEREGMISAAARVAAEGSPISVESHRRPAYREASQYIEHVRRELVELYGDRATYQAGLRIYTAVDVGMQKAAERAVAHGLELLSRRRGYRGPLRTLGVAPAEAFLMSAAEELKGVPLVREDTSEALVVRVEGSRVALRIGPHSATLSAEEMKWAGKPDQFSKGDVIGVRVEDPDSDPIRVSLFQEPEVEGALLAVEAYTGYVRAMVGGYDFGRSQFNRAVQAHRQPGSAFKPLLYAAALDNGFTPASVIVDAPIVYDDRSTNEVWKPKNFGRKFYGATRLREALAFSRNVISVKLVEQLGIDTVLTYLPRFGFERPFPRNLSIALGSSEVTLLELVRAYTAFANGGRLMRPIFILKVTDADGNSIEENFLDYEQILSPETAFQMSSMLQEVVRRGTGTGARGLHQPVGGKTGTTNDLMDAWFLGFTPDLVAGVWVGFDEKKTLGKRETGARAALPIWLEFMQEVLEGQPVGEFPVPPGIVFVNVDPKTGLRATPGSGAAVLEAFRRGTEPERFARRAGEPAGDDFFRGDF